MATENDVHYRMCKKIAQLTKVIYHLNVKNEDLEDATEALRAANDVKLAHAHKLTVDEFAAITRELSASRQDVTSLRRRVSEALDSCARDREDFDRKTALEVVKHGEVVAVLELQIAELTESTKTLEHERVERDQMRDAKLVAEASLALAREEVFALQMQLKASDRTHAIQRDESASVIADLRQGYDDTIAALATLHVEYQRIQSEHEALQRAKKGAESALQDLSLRSEQALFRHDENETNFKRLLSSSMAEVADLRERLRKCELDLQQALGYAASDNLTSSNLAAELQGRVYSLTEACESLRKQRDGDARAWAEERQIAVSRANSATSVLESRLAEALAELSRANAEAEATLAQLDDARRKYDSLGGQLEASRQSCSERDAQVASLTGELELAQRDLLAARHGHQRSRAELQSSLDAHRLESDALIRKSGEAEASRASNARVSLETESALRQRISQLEASLATLQQSSANSSELDAVRKRCEALTIELDSVRQDAAVAAQQASHELTQSKRMWSERRSLAADQSSAVQAREMEALVAQHGREVSVLRAEADTLRGKVSQLESQLQGARASMEGSAKNNSDASAAALRDMDRRLQSALDEAAAAKKILIAQHSEELQAARRELVNDQQERALEIQTQLDALRGQLSQQHGSELASRDARLAELQQQSARALHEAERVTRDALSRAVALQRDLEEAAQRSQSAETRASSFQQQLAQTQEALQRTGTALSEVTTRTAAEAQGLRDAYARLESDSARLLAAEHERFDQKLADTSQRHGSSLGAMEAVHAEAVASLKAAVQDGQRKLEEAEIRYQNRCVQIRADLPQP